MKNLKKNLVSEKVDEAVEEAEKQGIFKTVDVPDPKLVDVMRETKTLQNDVLSYTQEVKALGAEMLKAREALAVEVDVLKQEMAQLNQTFVNTVDHFIEAVKDRQQPIPQTAPTTTYPTDTQIVQLKWKSNKYGEWAFRTDQQGNETANAKPLADAIRATPKQKLIANGYEYGFSGDDNKFITRRKAK